MLKIFMAYENKNNGSYYGQVSKNFEKEGEFWLFGGHNEYNTENKPSDYGRNI